MEPNTALCPACGQPWRLRTTAAPGDRTFCRHCGTQIELQQTQPPKLVTIPRNSEDFDM